MAIRTSPQFEVRRASLWGAAVALALHGGVALSLARVDPGAWTKKPPPVVELEVIEKVPPPPDPLPPPPPAPEPPPPAPKPKLVRKVAIKPAEPPPAPPPPNQEPPPEPPPTDQPPPVFGVTLDSTVTGDSAFAVPVGNTTMTAERKRPENAPPPQPYVAQGPPPFAPVADVYVAEKPRVKEEVTVDYPAEARRLGIEGRVRMKVGIDRRGAVRAVRVIAGVGAALDQAAVKAMWRFKFTPARTSDGRTVDVQITYDYTFRAD